MWCESWTATPGPSVQEGWRKLPSEPQFPGRPRDQKPPAEPGYHLSHVGIQGQRGRSELFFTFKMLKKELAGYPSGGTRLSLISPFLPPPTSPEQSTSCFRKMASKWTPRRPLFSYSLIVITMEYPAQLLSVSIIWIFSLLLDCKSCENCSYNIRIHTYTQYTYTHIHMHTHMHIYEHMLCTHMHVHAHTDIHMCTHMHLCIHTYIHATYVSTYISISTVVFVSFLHRSSPLMDTL